ncbi:hypothetical protein BGX27_000493 [Mortierella sp. AM989]|nr:hypothetical protein BGX27_000493 [Mortierella sp. AM989]
MTNSSTEKPSVIISGAGIGGLMLGALLEQIDIPYHIHERAKEIRPLGSAISLGGNILPVFEQLGLLDDIKRICQPYAAVQMYSADMKNIGAIHVEAHKEVTGYDFYFVARPKLYELLLQKVPAHKITLGSKVLRVEESQDKVIVHCSNNAKHEADILVGADGAYSAVRQSLYKSMDEKGTLPKKDLESLDIWHIAMVGVAKPPNPEKYPGLSEGRTRFHQVVGEGKRDWYVINTSKDEICWGIGLRVANSEAEVQHCQASECSEWGPEGIDAMANEFRDLECPLGGTMGEIFDATPKRLISKVCLAEKNFQTWFHGRTVLIGDACHKMLPGAGQGALMAMQDAVVLANGLYRLVDKSSAGITAVFEDYYRLHHPDAEQRIKNGEHTTELMSGKSWTYQFIRYAYFNFMPYWLLKHLFKKEYGYRPQIAWLPRVVDPVSGEVIPVEKREKINVNQVQPI